ncbi:NDR1/HIN1-like protein 13 [Phalaenopsis equestris]|uniref:NDR1/HIN1-like protein 13 n=1 Tax=Phalaenopsis equestris TaxID=78828 RepID=UPI0009E20030|nr:NDR1/HIN1-like protein 13 [Phalaenopsis equestris]
MADRVHPEPTLPPPADSTLKPQPTSASFVIQLPKDQIYRIPPPENAYRFNLYTRRNAKRHRGSCRSCLAFSIIVLFLLFISLAIALGIIFLIFLPKLPSFSINSLSIQNISTSSEIDLTIRSENPNKKNGIYYLNGGSVDVEFSGKVLCRGDWPAFYQGKRNVTMVKTALKGSGTRLSDDVRGRLTAAGNRREVPLGIYAELPMRMKFGAVKMWTVTVKLRCDVTVDKLTAASRVRKESCRVKADAFTFLGV